MKTWTMVTCFLLHFIVSVCNGRKACSCYESYIIGHNITESPVLEPVTEYTKTHNCSTGICTASRVQAPNGAVTYIRSCASKSDHFKAKDGCIRVIAKNETTDTCYCSGDLCNADQNWSTATENSTSLKCHYESPAGLTELNEVHTDILLGTAYCSSGSCVDFTIGTPEHAQNLTHPGNYTFKRSRGCITAPVNGCTSGLPEDLPWDSAYIRETGSNVTNFCACNTDFCNDDSGSGMAVLSSLGLVLLSLTISKLIR
ncbi:hypothetical protein BV898_03199 [Hypsibius exemplaris]|uniref:Protein quiver n=1 Tax=Hypsibius exemplaris TaxID=2072580 RepID=A0A1W0X617_HYPEX|nr:hypothetical protein BV898_03199 [Hypsibius exemplaris]